MFTEQKDDTIKFITKFYGFDNRDKLVDPDTVYFILYDDDFDEIDKVELTDDNRVREGVFEYYFTPEDVGIFTVEFKGEFGGMPSLKRERIKIVNV